MFTLKVESRLPTGSNSYHLLVSVQLDYTLNSFERGYYTFLDFLSDIGGIQSIIVGLCAGSLSAIKYDYFDDFLVSSLYKLAPSGPSAKDRESFKLDKACNIVGYIRDIVMTDKCKAATRSR